MRNTNIRSSKIRGGMLQIYIFLMRSKEKIVIVVSEEWDRKFVGNTGFKLSAIICVLCHMHAISSLSLSILKYLHVLYAIV